MHPKDIPSATQEQMLREILDVLTCMRNGYFTTHLTDKLPGIGGEIAGILNEHLRLLEAFHREHLRITEEVGVTGRLGGQIELPDCTGAWREMADATNRLSANVTAQHRDFANTLREWAQGNSAARVTARFIAGEYREFREQVNELGDRIEQGKAATRS